MADKMIVDQREYPLGRVQQAEMELEIRHGSLNVTGGASEFCSATFEYSHPELRPVDEYQADGDEARLQITQPETDGLINSRSRWSIALSSSPAVELAVLSRSGAVRLDLGGVNVANLEVESRSGAVETRLNGSYPQLEEVVLDSRSGKVSALLDGEFPTLSQVEIESRSGTTEIVLNGSCPNLRRVAIDSRSGNVDVDMRGTFQREDLGLRIDCASGNVRVRLPDDVGASMNANTKSGRIRAEGFSTGSGRRTNAAFGSTPATIWLNLHLMSGNVDVISG